MNKEVNEQSKIENIRMQKIETLGVKSVPLEN